MSRPLSAEDAAALAQHFKAKPSKYRNVKTVVDGITFASRKEAKRYGELKLLEKAGLISGLQWQYRFSLDVNRVHVCDYVADFIYRDHSEASPVGTFQGFTVEDVKGKRTREYITKRNLMQACHGVIILET